MRTLCLDTWLKYCTIFMVLALWVASAAMAQQSVVVPTLLNFNGTLVDVNGKPLTGVQGGTPLWMETQNVYPDKSGRYTVQLGATMSQGLPSDLFASSEARWLEVQVAGQSEQPHVMLLSVPYALKAADAQTVGGLPASGLHASQ